MSDSLLLDLSGARRLAGALTAAAEELFSDQLALRSLLEEATTVLRVDRTEALVPLAAARRSCATLGADLRGRIDHAEIINRRLDLVDGLSDRLAAWPARLDEAGRTAVAAERRRLLLRLVDDDLDHARRIERAMAPGRSAADAFAAVTADLHLAERIEGVMAAFGIDLAAARAMIERVDRALPDLLDRGYSRDDAAAALAIVENFDLDLPAALGHATAHGIDLPRALGRQLAARAVGVTLEEYAALAGLDTHFARFDGAIEGSLDQRVSVADLRHVVEQPWNFTPSQVLAAQALLDQPILRNRLDTANHHSDLFGEGGFGSTDAGDGLIADVDLRAFMLKAQLHTILGDYRDRIDTANDPTGVVDGFRSANDFRAFIADNPDLPEPVRAAAGVALEAGWFDETWWDAHKDELAMGAALLAAGLVVVASGGSASMLLVVGAGAAAGGGTTIAVNLATGAPVLDDVFMNTVRSGFIGAGVHGVAAGVAAHAAATTGVARVAAMAGATSGAADVVATGGLDLLIEERYEATIHEVADEISTVTGSIDLGHGASEWATRSSVTFDSVEEQLEALAERVSRQKQLRHLSDSPTYRHGGYFDDAIDAQRVLDAVHDGSAEVIGITRGQDLLVRYDGVTGVHLSHRPGPTEVPTTTFAIKGTAKPSVVPTRPGRTD